jgi:hypothetical protein
MLALHREPEADAGESLGIEETEMKASTKE